MCLNWSAKPYRMPKLNFYLNIPANQLKRYYQGSARDIVASSHQGPTVRFAARLIRPFVSSEGVYGHFEIEFTPQGKFINLRKLDHE